MFCKEDVQEIYPKTLLKWIPPTGIFQRFCLDLKQLAIVCFTERLLMAAFEISEATKNNSFVRNKELSN